MNILTLSGIQRQIRQNIRIFLLTATEQELIQEYRISVQNGDNFRADCIKELSEERETYEQMCDQEDSTGPQEISC